jgi:hypothetical protein
MNLYNDPVFDGESEAAPKPSGGNVTNTNNSRRSDDFGAHYSMTDSPGAQQNENMPPSKRSSTRGDMDQHWTFSEPQEEKKIYKTAGDGMGGQKGGYNWMTGENNSAQKVYKTAGDGMGGRTGGRGWAIGDEVGARDDNADVRYSGRGRRFQPQQPAQAGAGGF